MTAAEMREAAAKEAIRALPADPAPLTTADAARGLLAKWNSWWCGEHATKEASHD